MILLLSQQQAQAMLHSVQLQPPQYQVQKLQKFALLIKLSVLTHVLSIVGTSDASSNAVQTWQGSTFALGILLAACIGIITGMCVIIIMRNFRKKKRLPNQLTGKEM